MVEVFLTFLRLGVIGLGGPIALVALIEQELCHNKKWLDLDKFAEIFAVCKLLPGPMAVQVAICCGYQRKGRLGGLLAGLGFLLPALLMIIVLAVLYTHNLNTQSKIVANWSKFMQVATLAIIIVTLWDLSKVYIKNISAVLIALLCCGIIYFKPGVEPLAILAFGISGLIIFKSSQKDLSSFPVIGAASIPKAITSYKVEFLYSKLIQLFWICIKAGEFSFGTGLAILPLLHGDLVSNLHWINDKQFLDGLTLGQVTPGPTTITIVFFGYLVAGVKGLLVSLVGFYIPPLFNALVIIPLFWKKLTASPYLKIFTMWAFPAVIGGILSATVKLGIAAVTNYTYVILLALALVIVIRKILPIWAVIPLYGIAGLLFGYFV